MTDRSVNYGLCFSSQLQQLVRVQSTKNQELEDELALYRARGPPPSAEHHMNGNIDGLLHISPSPSSDLDHSHGVNHGFRPSDTGDMVFDFRGLPEGSSSGAFGGAGSSSLAGLVVKEESSADHLEHGQVYHPAHVEQQQQRQHTTSNHRRDSESQGIHQNHHPAYAQMETSPSAGGSGSNGSDVDHEHDLDEDEGGEESVMIRGRDTVRGLQARWNRSINVNGNPSAYAAFDGSALSEGEDEDALGDVEGRAGAKPAEMDERS